MEQNGTDRFTPFLENAVAVQRKWNGPFLEQFFDAYRTLGRGCHVINYDTQRVISGWVWLSTCNIVWLPVHTCIVYMFVYSRRKKKVPPFNPYYGRPFKKKTGGERGMNGNGTGDKWTTVLLCFKRAVCCCAVCCVRVVCVCVLCVVNVLCVCVRLFTCRLLAVTTTCEMWQLAPLAPSAPLEVRAEEEEGGGGGGKGKMEGERKKIIKPREKV